MTKREGDRRSIERREPKRAVTIRHDDADDFVPKRIKRARHNITTALNPPTSNKDD